jgi:hypothetical protein
MTMLVNKTSQYEAGCVEILYCAFKTPGRGRGNIFYFARLEIVRNNTGDGESLGQEAAVYCC